MIIENNVNLIVSTCNTKEAGRAKCEQFWPKSEDKPIHFEVSQDGEQKLEVSLKSTSKISEYLNVRQLEAKDSNDKVYNVT